MYADPSKILVEAMYFDFGSASTSGHADTSVWTAQDAGKTPNPPVLTGPRLELYGDHGWTRSDVEAFEVCCRCGDLVVDGSDCSAIDKGDVCVYSMIRLDANGHAVGAHVQVCGSVTMNGMGDLPGWTWTDGNFNVSYPSLLDDDTSSNYASPLGQPMLLQDVKLTGGGYSWFNGHASLHVWATDHNQSTSNDHRDCDNIELEIKGWVATDPDDRFFCQDSSSSPLSHCPSCSGGG